MSIEPALIVIAKAPVAGRVKTRLCPPCTPAAGGAARAGRARGHARRAAARPQPGAACWCSTVTPGAWLPHGWEVVAQRGDGLAERLAAAFADAAGRRCLVGMDTPQVTAGAAARRRSRRSRTPTRSSDRRRTAATGRSACASPTRPCSPRVPMSRDDTGAVQRARLGALGLRTVDLPPLLDVDDDRGARAVAADAPAGRFAAALGASSSAGRGMTVTARAPRRSHTLEPAELLYGRLLASAAAGGEPTEARFRLAGGRLAALPLHRWLAPVDAADRAVLAHAAAPVLDIGCGPGRHLAALAAAGHEGARA